MTKRTHEWWSRLTAQERSELWYLERANNECGSDGYGYLPEGYSDCGICSTPTSIGGICSDCLGQLIYLLDKADGKVIECPVCRGETDLGMDGPCSNCNGTGHIINPEAIAKES